MGHGQSLSQESDQAKSLSQGQRLVLTVTFSTPATIIARGSSGQVGGISRPGAHSNEVAKVIDGCFSLPSNVPRRVP